MSVEMKEMKERPLVLSCPSCLLDVCGDEGETVFSYINSSYLRV
jgi:hypothetical protein